MQIIYIRGAPGNAPGCYIYTCDCKPGINVLAGIWPIVQTMSKRPDGKYVYTITKTGLSAQDNPLAYIARAAH